MSAARIKPRLSGDDWIMRAAMGVIGLYLIVTLALPLYSMFSKSFETYSFELDLLEIQIVSNGVPGEVVTAQDFAETQGLKEATDPRTAEIERVWLRTLIPNFDRSDTSKIYRLRDLSPDGGRLMVKGKASGGADWLELDADTVFRTQLKPAQHSGFENFAVYINTPSLANSIWNSVWVSLVTTVITVTLAFWYAYALTRSCMRGKAVFKAIVTIPLLVPSLLPGIALVYLFGNQGLLKDLLMGETIYGPIGIVAASVFFTLPHAMLILLVALGTADQRLYEAATALRATRWRTFWTVTIPGARYGLISAFFVVFTLTITDFGVPKVIGGQFNMLAVDIYKQVIGQQNFQMGSVVAVVLLVPALLAFVVDRFVQKRQVALLSARAVPYQPKPARGFDRLMLAYCCLIAFFILGLMLVAQGAAIFKLWPYDLSFSFKNFNFDQMDGGGWDSYWNSLELGAWTALIGTTVVFSGAYLVEKSRGFRLGRGLFQFLAMLPMAIPGMVLGLAYIFFFNNPDNPFNFIYQTMGILVVCTVAHFYTVAHLTAVTALKQIDNEFEAVSASLKRSVFSMFRRVTVPVSIPALLDISIYLFVNAMTTVSAVVFIYGPHTTLASVAVLNMDDAGDIAPAAAMAMMIFYSNLGIRALQSVFAWWLERRTQAWRKR